MNYLKKFDKRFYKTYVWKKKRIEILKRDNYECQRCKLLGQFSMAKAVHHIKHYDKHPELALSDDNLISLCSNCHNLEHPEKFFESKQTDIHSERFE